MTPILAGPADPADTPPPAASQLPPELTGGDASKCSYAIGSIQIQGADPIELVHPGVTAVVGGNNAGKSTLLRQIRDMAALDPGMPQTSGAPHLLTGMTSAKQGTPADLAAWLLQHTDLVTEGVKPAGFRRYGVAPATVNLLAYFWQSDQLARLSGHLMHYAGARDRHTWTAGTGRRDDFTSPATHPIHSLEFDEERLDELSEIAMRAFRKPLTIDPLSGQVQFRVGSPNCEIPPYGRPTVEYQNELGALDLLANQGDGMVFMLGALIPIVAATFPVVLLDEPEAFLHPPQAYLMGRALADLAVKRQLQLIVATHDRNILRGLLSAPTAAVNILRLSRENDTTTARLLPVEKVRKISNDNVLRHTNILDGLFHRLVVLAENERDCRFYQAALEHLDGQGTLPVPAHDVLFIPTNGKGNMAGIADVLKDTGVRIVASPDLDVLNDRTVVRKLLTALGGEWTSHIDALYARATKQLATPPEKLLNKDVLATVASALNEDPAGVFEGSRADRVKAALKVANPWDALKQRGKSALGADKPAREELLELLDAAGLVTVAVGELENFDPDASRSSKDAWLRDALTNGAHTRPDVAAHIQRLLQPSPATQAATPAN